MSIRKEQCNKVCRILDDVLANRPTERDSLVIAVRKAFEALELFGNSEQLPSAQPEIIRCTECKHYREYDSEYVENAVVVQCMADRYPISETIPDGWFCAGAERKDDE